MFAGIQHVQWGYALSRGRWKPISRCYRIYRTIPKRWPSIDQCHMFTGIPCIYTEMSRDVTTQILCVLIGQGSLSRPMICLRCRSAYLRMFFTTIVVMVSEAFKPRVRFSKAIYIIAKDCIDIMMDLVSRAKHLLAFPSFKLSLWWFLKLI